jgi:transposase
VDSVWRHLDLGVYRLEVRARLRRLWCPTDAAHTEGIPLARPAYDFTGDFESLVAWLATRTDKTATTRLVRVAWRTVGRIIARVVADELDPHRLHGLFVIGVDEISWRNTTRPVAQNLVERRTHRETGPLHRPSDTSPREGA